jgi:hypothetical protein
MGTWMIGAYLNEEDREPSHRAIAQGATEEEALKAAADFYNECDLVVSIGRTIRRAKTEAPVFEVWAVPAED